MEVWDRELLKRHLRPFVRQAIHELAPNVTSNGQPVSDADVVRCMRQFFQERADEIIARVAEQFEDKPTPDQQAVCRQAVLDALDIALVETLQ